MITSNVLLDNEVEFKFFSLEEFNDRIEFESLVEDLKGNWFMLSKSSSEYIIKNLELFGLICSEKTFEKFFICRVENNNIFKDKLYSISECCKEKDITIAIATF